MKNKNKNNLFELYEDLGFDLPESQELPKMEVLEVEQHEAQVDGLHVLAKLRGPSFAYNTTTRNNRFYSKGLWEKALAKTQERVKAGNMWGTIGHDQPLTDQALLEGKASHKVSKLWVENGVGMSEILIVNTEAGNRLNTYVRSGSDFPVSTRALGEYKGKTDAGADMVDEDSYELQTIDFVQTPGLATAIPKLVEDKKEQPVKEGRGTTKLESDIDEETIMQEKAMLESLVSEKNQVSAELAKALDANKTLEVKNEALTLKLETLENAKNEAESQVEELEKSVTTLKAELKAFEEMGSADDVRAALEQAKEVGEELGDLGTVEEFQNALKAVEAYEALGTVEDLATVKESLKAYEAIGTVEKIQEAFEKAMEMAKSHAEEKAKNEAAKFAEDTGISVEVAAELLSKFEVEDAIKLVANLSKTNTSEELFKRYNIQESTENKDEKEVEDDEKRYKTSLDESRMTRLMKNVIS